MMFRKIIVGSFCIFVGASVFASRDWLTESSLTYERQLELAITSTDLDAIKRLLGYESGKRFNPFSDTRKWFNANANSPSPNGLILPVAFRCKNKDIMAFILDNSKVDVNFVYRGYTPADWAAFSNRIGVYEELRKRGGKIHESTRDHVNRMIDVHHDLAYTPLKVLVDQTEVIPDEHYEDLVDEKIEHFRNVEILGDAMADGRVDDVERLLIKYKNGEIKLDINAPLTSGAGPALNEAATETRPYGAKIVRLILEHCKGYVNVNLVHRHCTPADEAAKAWNLETFKALKEHGGKIHESVRGLHFTEDLRLLVDEADLISDAEDSFVPPQNFGPAKASLPIRGLTRQEDDEHFRNGWILYYAIRSFDTEEVERLMKEHELGEFKLDMNARLKPGGYPALHQAVDSYDSAKKVGLILKHSKADINRLYCGYTPTDWVFNHLVFFEYETCEMLLKNGGKIHRDTFDQILYNAAKANPENLEWAQLMELARDKIID
ncbi:MAG: hypothetical protein LBQ43_04265 [Holosporales bacterium]|jgi:hypothetical protein|nr:hypothetical protein [Holosporales bacterium]